MLSLRRARGVIRWLSLVSPSARLPQDVCDTLEGAFRDEHVTYHAKGRQCP
jgi:hypothetical protein